MADRKDYLRALFAMQKKLSSIDSEVVNELNITDEELNKLDDDQKLSKLEQMKAKEAEMQKIAEEKK